MRWCDNTDFADATFDPAKVAEILEGAGWAKGSDGIYAKDGQRLSDAVARPCAGNARREADPEPSVSRRRRASASRSSSTTSTPTRCSR